MPSSIETLAPAPSVKRCVSGLMTSMSVSGTSAPVTVFGPLTSTRTVRGSPAGTWIVSFLRFSSTSAVLSVTPAIGWSALLRPSIFTHDTAEPGTMLSRVRRSEWPTVSA